MSEKRDPERVVREIKRKTRLRFSTEEKIRIVLEGLKGEDTIAGQGRREGINSTRGIHWQVSVSSSGMVDFGEHMGAEGSSI